MRHIDEAFLPTRFGRFTVHAFEDDGHDHLALVRCSHPVHDEIPVRIHSRCLTGDTLTSLRCDCREQLEAAMEYLEEKECGILIYLDQEGRGIGLANKIRAYALQDKGMDTVDANLKLGFREDQRDYRVAGEMLKYFGIRKIALMTNNPKKIEAIEECGIEVSRRIPLITKTNQYNESYMKTKKEKMGHQF